MAGVEGSAIRNHPFDRAIREGVVGDAAGDDGAIGEVADVLPAEGDAGLDRRGSRLLAVVGRPGRAAPDPGSPGGSVPRAGVGDAVVVGDAERVAGVALEGLAGEADAGEALRRGEDDAAVGIVPSVGFVLAHDGELDAVDGEELVEGQAEGHGGEDVDLDEGLATGVVGAESILPSPFGGEGGEVVRQAGVLSGPGIGAEGVEGGSGSSGIGALVGCGRVPVGWFVRSDAAPRATGGGLAAGDIGAAGRFVRGDNFRIAASGRPVGSGCGTGGRFACGGRAFGVTIRGLAEDDGGVSRPGRGGGDGVSSGATIRRPVGDDGGVSRPGRTGDGGVSEIIRELFRGGGVSGHGSASGRLQVIRNGVANGGVPGMIRRGWKRRLAVADLGPQVGVVAGQAAEA